MTWRSHSLPTTDFESVSLWAPLRGVTQDALALNARDLYLISAAVPVAAALYLVGSKAL